MSYDIRLKDPVTGETLRTALPHQMQGGTCSVFGTDEMWLNVTYNYADWYYYPGVFPGKDGIRSIYDLSGAESIPVLTNAISILKALTVQVVSQEDIVNAADHGCDGYWLPTKENAIKPLYQLLAFAQMRPDGVWDGD